MPIPKILHQLWIGPKPRPSIFMDICKEKNPDFEYILWTEEELKKRDMRLQCGAQINSMSEINGKADIIRWEILYKYGGIFVDADCICIEPFADDFTALSGFASYECETNRPGLVATTLMGFQQQHPLCLAAIQWILTNNISVEQTKQRAWITVGPGLLTRQIQSGRFSDVSLFPSYYFLPKHYTGTLYKGHGKIYSHHEWGSTYQNYEGMNGMVLPVEFREPKQWVSLLITSYNTKAVYIAECLESIKAQEGQFGMEIVWIDDGSDQIHTRILERSLNQFQQTTRFCKMVYRKMEENRGLSKCLQDGVLLCSNELIFRMDSDDIMTPQRIQKQLDFLNRNPDVVLVGSNVQMFRTNEKNEKMGLQQTQFPLSLTWDQYKTIKSHWFMQHPTLCFKKSAVLEVGNYADTQMCEDLELEIKILKRFGKIANLQEPLVQYRIHPGQITFQGKSSTPYWVDYRNKMIDSLIQS
jgi:hypothetical protein